MVVGLVANQNSAVGDGAGFAFTRRSVLEVADDLGVRVEDEVVDIVDSWRGEAPVGANRHDGFDSRSLSDNVVILTESAGGVHESRTIARGDEVAFEDAEGVFVVGKVGKRRSVGVAQQVGTLEFGNNGRLFAEFAGIRSQALLGDDVAFRAAGGAIGFDDEVVDVRSDDDREVGRKRPRRGRPDEEAGVFQRGVSQRTGRTAQADGDSRVLAVLVDVVVHAQFVVRQRGFI